MINLMLVEPVSVYRGPVRMCVCVCVISFRPKGAEPGRERRLLQRGQDQLPRGPRGAGARVRNRLCKCLGCLCFYELGSFEVIAVLCYVVDCA